MDAARIARILRVSTKSVYQWRRAWRAGGLTCFKAGQPGRFYYRMRGHRLRPGTRRAMTEADYAALITAAHRYLHAPVIVIWDNLNAPEQEDARLHHRPA